MVIDPSEFRRVLGHWATGVAIVATRDGAGEPCGLTVNAFTSLSLDPPLVLVCIDRAANSHDCLHDAGIFSVNVLARDGEPLARRFAGDGGGKFEGVPSRPAVTGAPVLEEALAWADCRLTATCPGGDHTVFIGEVLAAGARAGEPLLFYRGEYGRRPD